MQCCIYPTFRHQQYDTEVHPIEHTPQNTLPRRRLRRLDISPQPISPDALPTNTPLPLFCALHNPLPNPHLPEPPLPQRPRGADADAAEQRRRRQQETHARHGAPERARSHGGHDRAHDGVSRVPDHAPEDEDAYVPQGAQEGARAPVRGPGGAGRVGREEEVDVLFGGAEGAGGVEGGARFGGGGGA